MVERIKQLMGHYELKAAQFADTIGMQRSAVSHVLSGRNKPSLDFMLRIKRRFPEINLDWLLLGNGGMFVHDVGAGMAGKSNSSGGTMEKMEENHPSAVQSTPSSEGASFVSKDESAFEVRSEPPAAYGVTEGEQEVEKMVVLYRNGTFKTYKPA